MRILWVSQLLVAIVAALIALLTGGLSDLSALLYGAVVGNLVSLLARRSTDRALEAAVEDPAKGTVVMFSGFFLRYAVAILGLLVGLRLLVLPTVPMLTGFILMILVQVAVSPKIRE